MLRLSLCPKLVAPFSDFLLSEDFYYFLGALFFPFTLHLVSPTRMMVSFSIRVLETMVAIRVSPHTHRQKKLSIIRTVKSLNAHHLFQVSFTFKNCLNTRQTIQLKKWTEGLNKHLSQENIQTAIRYRKKY